MGAEFTYTKLNNEFKKGAKLKTTNISDEFTFHDLMSQQKNQRPLLALDKKQNLMFFTQDSKIVPKSGWKVTSLVLSEADA